MKTVVAMMCGCVMACSQLLGNPVVVDDFNDNSTDLALWEVDTRGTGPQITETNGRLEIAFPANTQPLDNMFYAGYFSNQVLHGDFDMQVDFELLNWPHVPRFNGIRVGLCLDWVRHPVEDPVGGSVVRASEPGVERYTTTARDENGTHWIAWSVVDDTAGSLRLIRSGSTLSGYYWNSGQWSLIGSLPVAAADGEISLAGWGHSDFIGQDVSFAFDNFVLNEGQLIPEPSSLVLLAIAGLGLLTRRRPSR